MMLKFFLLATFMTLASASSADANVEKMQQLEVLLEKVLQENNELRHKVDMLETEAAFESREVRQRFQKLEAAGGMYGKTTPYNVTIEELEIRVERLEEDMFEAQVDINEVRIDVDELQYSVQETIDTVMDHTENLNALDESIGELGNRTSAVETDVADLEITADDHEARISSTEQIYDETKDSAFFATLTSDIVFENNTETIPFDDAKINEGGHYNTTTGTYTAPVAGIYEFFTYINARPRGSSHIRIDGVLYANPAQDYSEDVREAEGATITVNLDAGQIVQITTGNDVYTVYGNGVTSWFGGHLLFPTSV